MKLTSLIAGILFAAAIVDWSAALVWADEESLVVVTDGQVYFNHDRFSPGEYVLLDAVRIGPNESYLRLSVSHVAAFRDDLSVDLFQWVRSVPPLSPEDIIRLHDPVFHGESIPADLILSSRNDAYGSIHYYAQWRNDELLRDCYGLTSGGAPIDHPVGWWPVTPVIPSEYCTEYVPEPSGTLITVTGLSGIGWFLAGRKLRVKQFFN